MTVDRLSTRPAKFSWLIDVPRRLPESKIGVRTKHRPISAPMAAPIVRASADFSRPRRFENWRTKTKADRELIPETLEIQVESVGYLPDRFVRQIQRPKDPLLDS